MEPHIDPLNSSNYCSWAEDMKAVLMDKDCWQYVIDKNLKQDPEATAKERREFNSRKSKAYSSIYLNTEKEFRSLISDTDDPVEAWERLKIHFQPPSRCRVISLLDEFFKLKPDEYQVPLKNSVK